VCLCDPPLLTRVHTSRQCHSRQRYGHVQCRRQPAWLCQHFRDSGGFEEHPVQLCVYIRRLGYHRIHHLVLLCHRNCCTPELAEVFDAPVCNVILLILSILCTNCNRAQNPVRTSFRKQVVAARKDGAAVLVGGGGGQSETRPQGADEGFDTGR